MALKFHNLYSQTFLFIISLSCFIICQTHHSPKLITSENSPTPLDFLKNLNGTHKGNQAKGLSKLKKYLANLGYIDYTNPTIPIHQIDDFFDDTLELAIKKYQNFYNIKTTGILDSETVTLMLQPRCGVADFLASATPHVNQTSFGYSKKIPMASHYNFSGYSWPHNKRNLTVSLPIDTRIDAYAPIFHALIRWISVSPFNFNYTDDLISSDVKISFERRDHEDGYPFDGPYGVLAHAFFPMDGRLHFDAEEKWMPYAEKGSFDLETVALHELGHILGLDHSQDPKSIMFAYIRDGETKDLTADDIQGIKSLYPDRSQNL